MATQPLPQTAEPPRQPTKPLAPVWRGVMAACVGYFLAWPVLFFACFPLLTPDGSLSAILLGAGSVLWLLSCIVMWGLLLEIIEAYTWKNTPQRIRMSRTIAVTSWFLGWFPLFAAYNRLTGSWIGQHYYWINDSLSALGTILWLVSCYWIYDMLFSMAEARWPAAKAARIAIREFAYLLFSLLRALRPH